MLRIYALLPIRNTAVAAAPVTRSFSSSTGVLGSSSNLFMQVMEYDSKANIELRRELFESTYRQSQDKKTHNVLRNERRDFGPAAYGVFLAKNVKACRGVRGKSFNIRISDSKWRYPKRGRH